ncbi:hypothetical protein H5410_018449 [Solanum commersonii]|uniref:Uncharacterized protein n=1 Tax=Solanum commersonii TaxID=4109 RepID=A0A9J6A263_SOLCO|nr:hypothetical protein H5410_018449 [Solanum commersonii]
MRNRGRNGIFLRFRNSKSGTRSGGELVSQRGARLLFRGFCRIVAATLTFLTAEEEGERGGQQ